MYKVNPFTGKFDFYESNEFATILKTKVVNKTTPSVTLSKAAYQVCLISGAQGQRLAVKLAKGDNDANSAGTLGIASETIAHNAEGYITSVGLIADINTTGSLQGETWNDGDVLYLSPFTFGAITNIKPTAPNHSVIVGYVEYAHNNHGKIYVKIDNGYELGELHDVAYPTTPTANDFLIYDGVQSRWENQKATASIIDYNNSTSGLTATTVQNAVDELNNQNYKEIYPVNWWNDFLNTNVTPASQSFDANRIRYQVIYIKKTVKVDRIRVTVLTPAAAGNTAVVGIYKEISNTGFGNPISVQLVAQANGTVNLASATTQEILFPSTVTLDEGIYFISTWLSATASLRGVRTSDNILGRSPTLTDYVAIQGQVVSAYTGTLPASTTVTGLDTQTSPLVLFKVVP
jgi:hypothetical protein